MEETPKMYNNESMSFLAAQARNKLIEFRERYSFTEYPYKVALEAFYRFLPLEVSFNSAKLQLNEHGILPFSDENYNFIYNVIANIYRKTQIEVIAPNIKEIYENDDSMPGFDIKRVKQMVNQAQTGDSNENELLEFTFSFTTIAGASLMHILAGAFVGMSSSESSIRLTGFGVNVSLSSFEEFYYAICNSLLILNPISSSAILMELFPREKNYIKLNNSLTPAERAIFDAECERRRLRPDWYIPLPDRK